MYLVDSNLLICLLQGDIKAGQYLARFGVKNFSISAVSRLEVLLGSDKGNFTEDEVKGYLDIFENLSLDKELVNEALALSKGLRKKLKFKDLVIAATAKMCKKTLLTADKDFKGLKGVKVRFFER